MTRPTSESTGAAQHLICTKLVPPKPPPTLVARPHLIEKMDRYRDGRVTLISAPAGYGKTTLVCQWLDADPQMPVAWLSLDRLDNDLARFVQYVAAALSGADKSPFLETEGMLAARNLPPSPVLAESIILGIERLGQRAVLVLDDYGFIRSKTVHEFMSALVSKLPSTLHLVVASRIDPALPLDLWRSRHWLHELRAADLRCTREEAETLFATTDEIDLGEEAIATVHSKTEGWVTGLRLAQLALAGSPDPAEQVRAFSASHRLVTDYLMEEVLARQPPEIREFLGISSVLERFSPELCDELAAGADHVAAGQSRDLIERLHRKNLFLVPLGPDRKWYRYHNLFRDLLLERFGKLTSAGSRVDLLRRAGDWFRANGWAEDGLTCFLAAGDVDAAEDLIGNHLHGAISDDLSRRSLARWLEMFPSAAEQDRIPLLVAAAYSRSFQSDFEGVGRLLDQIDAVCGNAPSRRQRRWQSVFQQDLDFFRGFASFWNGDIQAAHQHLARIFDRESDPPEILAMFSILYYGGSLALTGRKAEYLHFVERASMASGAAHGPQQLPFLVVKAAVHFYWGELAECRDAALRLTTSTGFSIPKYFESIGYYFLGAVAYERHQLDEAKQHLLAGESRRSEAPAVIDHATATALAQLELVRGDLAAAERYAEKARSIALESGSPMLLRISEAVEMHIAKASGRPPNLAGSPPAVNDFTYLSILQPIQSWAWFQMQSPVIETRQVALDVVDAALEQAEMHGVTCRVIQLSALRALALDALKRRDEAIGVFETALRRGTALGFVRSFVDLGEDLRPLLRAVAERHPDDGNVAAILAAFEAPRPHPPRQIEPREVTSDAGPLNASAPDHGSASASLTNRELDVLELLARRLTNKEIAARLGISAGTVKMHTLGIYRKLEVRGRRQAVAEALEQGILTD